MQMAERFGGSILKGEYVARATFHGIEYGMSCYLTDDQEKNSKMIDKTNTAIKRGLKHNKKWREVTGDG